MTIKSLQIAAEKFTTNRPSRPTIRAYADNLKAKDRITPAVQEAIDNAHRIRLKNQVVFYIAGALTGMSNEVKDRYAIVSELIATQSHPRVTMFGYAPHLYGTDPVKHPDLTPQEVRDIDFLWAAIVPDGHINFWEPIAHGNAIEAAWAERYGIPSLHLVPEGLTTSRLVRGMDNIAATLVYTNFQANGLLQIQAFLKEVTAAALRQSP